MKKQLQIICVGLLTLNLQLITQNSFSQNVGINSDGTAAESGTMLDIKSAGTTSATFGLKVKDSDATDKFVVRSDGNVGIGTSTPSAKLSVEGDTDPVSIRLTESTATDAEWELRSYDSFLGGSGNQFSIWGGLSGGTQTDRITITPSGNVGIGATNPQYLFHLLNSSTAAFHLERTGAVAGTMDMHINSGPYVGSPGRSGLLLTSEHLAFRPGEDKSLVVATNQGGTVSEAFTIEANANVGIGDAGPDALLEISTSGGSEDPLMLSSNDANNGDLFIVKNSGNTGIGTTNPYDPLHIHGDKPKQRFYHTGSERYAQIYTHAVNEQDVGGNNLSLGGTMIVGVAQNGIIGSTADMWNGTNHVGAAYIAMHGYSEPALYKGNIQFYTRNDNGNAAERMRIIPNGDVGIGTSTPTAKFQVFDNTSQGIYSVRALGTTIGQYVGGIAFGGYNSSSDIVQYAAINGVVADNTPGSEDGDLIFHTKTNGTLSTKMTIDNNGNVGIGTISPSYKLEVCGTIGTTAVAVTTGITCSSDIRFKKNIKPLSEALSKIKNINGVTYNWKADEFPDKNFNDEVQIGVIAQELEKVYPELVHTDKEGYKSVDYSHLTPILIEAIKEQQEVIETLKISEIEHKKEIENLKAEAIGFEKYKTENDRRLKLIEEYIKVTEE